MTTIDDVPIVGQSEIASDKGVNRGLRWIESWLERFSDRLNPILVKEARQALKSRQFLITFTMLLAFGWMWSIFGVVIQMPGIYYAPTGLFMLTGYYFILAVPLLLIVPFSAFRSLASEREDGTYELLSISTLNSRQIVTGKLGSAVLQMMVYYSALAPCIAFTYLLRGVDIVTIGLLLTYTFLISVLLSVIGLVSAGLSKSRQWQTLISVLLLLALFAVCWAWGAIVAVVASQGIENIPMDELQFWIAQGVILTAHLSYFTLLVLIAAAQNSFASDNRSTSIRIAMLVQTVLFVGWVGYFWVEFGFAEMLGVMMIFAGIHWYVYGALMTSESAELSPRVKRQLPRSFLGRVLLTWFNPGSGTGYVFAVSNLAMLLALMLTAVFVQSEFGFPESIFASAGTTAKMVTGSILVFAYVVAYLGLTRLIIVLIPNRSQYGLVLPVLLHVLMALVGCAVPFFLQSWRQKFQIGDYSTLQASNWLWTLEETFDDGMIYPEVIVAVCAVAAGIFFVNILLATREIEAVRLDAPQRVMEDDGALVKQD